MSTKEKFTEEIKNAYSFKEDYITLGDAVYAGECINNLYVIVPLKTLNRHGLITGATGTGKTKTLQVRQAITFYSKPQHSVRKVYLAECIGILFCRFTILCLMEWRRGW